MMPDNNIIKVGLADNSALFREAFASLLASLGYSVIVNCANCRDLMNKLDDNNLPDVLLIDLKLLHPEGNFLWPNEQYPSIRMVGLGFEFNKDIMNKIRDCGGHGFLHKTIDPGEIKSAFKTLIKTGRYYPARVDF